jgi:SlyX protein
MEKSENERLDDIEILVAHQSRMIDDLNDVIVAQNETIAELRRRLDRLMRQVEMLDDTVRTDVPVDKPPHW